MISMFRAVALINFIFLMIQDDEILKVNWNIVYKFMGAMSVLTLFRLMVMYGSSPVMLQSNPTGFLLVGLEDLAFGGTIYIFSKYISTRQLFLLPVIVVVSLLFGFGHLAYGLWWAILMCFVPAFVFVKYGTKHGIYTTMLCHIIFDSMTFFTVKFINLMNLLG